MSFIKSDFVFLFYLKNVQNNFTLSNKPLLILNNDDHTMTLNHLRDVDFQSIVKEGDEVDIGILRIHKNNLKNLFFKIISTKDIHQNGVDILFSTKYKINIKNKRTFFEESIRGEDSFDIHHNFNMNFTYIQYKDMDVKRTKNKNKINEEYLLCIPRCEIKPHFIPELKRLI